MAILFGIAGLPLEESLDSSTPSHIYGEGSEDSRVVPSTTGRDAIGKYIYVCFAVRSFLCSMLTCMYSSDPYVCFIVLSDDG